MNYNKLKYFYEIAQLENLSHAAEKLFVSQSSLSKAIADLEDDFGRKLFCRAHRRLTLTPAGKELLKQIKSFFESEKMIYQKVRSVPERFEEKIAEIKIGYMATEAGLNIPPFIRTFKEDYPQIDVSSKRLVKALIESSLQNNKIDLAYFAFETERKNPQVNVEILVKSQLGAVLNIRHPLANEKKLSLDDLKSEQFIMLGERSTPSEYNRIIDWCGSQGFYVNIIDAFERVETVLIHLQNTRCVSLLSERAPYKNFKDLVFVPIENSLALNDGFMWNKAADNEYIHLFIKEFKKWHTKLY